MICKKLPIDTDLSEASLEEAKNLSYNTIGGPCDLYVSSNLIKIANELVLRSNCKVFLDTLLPVDSWYLTTKYSGVYSTGA